MGMPRQIERGPVIVTGGIDYQRVPLPMCNRVAHPGRIGIFGQRTAIRKKLAEQGLIFVKDYNEVWRLNDFYREAANRNSGFRTRRETMDSVRVPAIVILALLVQGRGPRQHLLRLDVARDVEQSTSIPDQPYS